MVENEIIDALITLGISTRESIIRHHGRVRDRDDIGVLKCNLSGVIVLDRTDHCTHNFYKDRDTLTYWGNEGRATALKESISDDRRRADMLHDAIQGKDWVDVGAGLGGVCDLLVGVAKTVRVVEPQVAARKCLQEIGLTAYEYLEEIEDCSADVISLFHVYEHIPDQLGFLSMIKRKMRLGGICCIEVPHARDALLSQYYCEAFRDFTFWSEHLILHTRESLIRFVTHAGMSVSSILGIQRYPLANHLYWLSQGKPGGHVAWPHLLSSSLDREYEQMLESLDLTDTLIAWIQN